MSFVCPNGHQVADEIAVQCLLCPASVTYVTLAERIERADLGLQLIEWADSLDLYAATFDGSPEMVRAVAVEMRAAARGRR